MYIDNPKKVIEICEWKSLETKIKHKINNIYQDDQIDVAVKILNYLKYKNIYISIDNEIIEFDTSEELNINPFLYVDCENNPKVNIYW